MIDLEEFAEQDLTALGDDELVATHNTLDEQVQATRAAMKRCAKERERRAVIRQRADLLASLTDDQRALLGQTLTVPGGA